MIVFNMKCGGGHGFEGWFDSTADYEAKAEAHAITCPECGGTDVVKGLSAPRVNTGSAPDVGPCGLPACGNGICSAMG